MIHRSFLLPSNAREGKFTRPHITAVLDDPARFRQWWNKRADPDDRAIVKQAERRGLIARSEGLLFLTPTGKELRGAADGTG